MHDDKTNCSSSEEIDYSFWPSLGQSEPAHHPLDAPYDSVVDETSTGVDVWFPRW